MLATAIIVFREVLEAALIVGIVLAASRGIARRGAWIMRRHRAPASSARCWSPPAPGTIAAAVAGMGQEVFNAAILLTAVVMLGWHNVWMTPARPRDGDRRQSPRGRRCAPGARPLWALAIAVGLAVLREGSEIVLFLYGIAATAGRDRRDGAGRRARRRRPGRPRGRRFISGSSAFRCAICSRSPAG